MELLIKGTLLKNIVEAIKESKIEFASFDFSPTGLTLQAIAPDSLALVSLYLKPEIFEVYSCDENTSIGINLVQFSHRLEIVTDEYMVGMKADQGKNNLQLMLENRSELSLCFCFRVSGLLFGWQWWLKSLKRRLAGSDEIAEIKTPLLDLDEDWLLKPEIEYPATVKMPSVTLEKIGSDLSQDDLGHVMICVRKEGVEFYNEKRVIHKKVKRSKIIIKLSGKPVALTYNLTYLRGFTKATPLSKMVTICLSPNIPAMVEYKINQDMGYIRFYFPPVLDEDNKPNKQVHRC